MAPNIQMVGVKVLDDSGTGTDTTLLNGLTWVQNNSLTYNIVAANMSFGYSVLVPIVDTAINNLVELRRRGCLRRGQWEGLAIR